MHFFLRHFHAVTGSDPTPYFYNIGKAKVFKKLLKKVKVTNLLLDLSISEPRENPQPENVCTNVSYIQLKNVA